MMSKGCSSGWPEKGIPWLQPDIKGCALACVVVPAVIERTRARAFVSMLAYCQSDCQDLRSCDPSYLPSQCIQPFQRVLDIVLSQ